MEVELWGKIRVNESVCGYMVLLYLWVCDVVVIGYVGGIDDERLWKKCRKVWKIFDDFKIV